MRTSETDSGALSDTFAEQLDDAELETAADSIVVRLNVLCVWSSSRKSSHVISQRLLCCPSEALHVTAEPWSSHILFSFYYY